MRTSVFGSLLSLSLLFAASADAQPKAPSPAQKVFAQFLALDNQQKLNTPAAKNIVTEEATRFTAYPQIGPFSAPDAFQTMDSHHAVTRVQALDGKVPTDDCYFYLTLTGGSWKVSAMRALAMTGIIEQVKDELEHKPQLTAKERDELANMKLTLALDHDLRAYFKTYRPQFDKLRALKPKAPATAALLRQLGLSYLSQDDDANVIMTIGGMVDNTVGYLYSAKNHPPKISPEEYIWMEKIADGWYLFRTT